MFSELKFHLLPDFDMEIKKIFSTRNPYIIFAPFLLFYVVFVILLPTNGHFGDEPYYIKFANNLLQGFYSPQSPNVDLMYGPGYPLFLVPFIALGLPLITITILNAVLYYFSIILLFKSLQHFVSYKVVLAVSLFWALYYHSYEQLHLIYTETLTSFLVSLIIFASVKVFTSTNLRVKRRYIVVAGFAFGYVALVKVLFGYVLVFMLLGSLVLYLINRKEANYLKGLLIMLISLVTVLPYLGYTYHLTGKIFYWGSSGGNNLYWMSSPHPREYGDWTSFEILEGKFKKFDPGAMPGRLDSIRAIHSADYEKLSKVTGVAQDELFKELAISNIKAHPIKFVQNCISNTGRMLFFFPNTYTLQRPINLLRIPLNAAIVFLSLFAFLITVINWRKLDYILKYVIFISLLYIGGSILGSSEPRMFSVIVPILLFWIAYVSHNTIKINWRFSIKNESL